MRERIVVYFRWDLASVGSEELSAHFERARRIREHATALGGSICAWSSEGFGIELLAECVEEALVLVAQATDESTQTPELGSFGIGISQGTMFPLADVSPFGALAFGTPLVIASGLARIARPGEVLLDPEMPAVAQGEVPTYGVSAGAVGKLRLRGLVLDPLHLPTLSPPPPPVGEKPRPSIAPGQSSGPERRHGMEALSKGDLAEALSALRKGVEKTKSAPPMERARAKLAHAVGLFASGREHEALLDGLDALARAREAEDARGEEACVRFLAKLCESVGKPELALKWRELLPPN